MLTSGPSSLDVEGLRAFIARDEVELDRFAFDQGFVSAPEDTGMMNEYILSRVPGDKAEAPLVIEPFHFSARHILFLPWGSGKPTKTMPPKAPYSSLPPQTVNDSTLGSWKIMSRAL